MQAAGAGHARLGVPGANHELLPGMKQVEVTVLPPDDGPPRKRSVGRRYSNFVTLFQRVSTGGQTVCWVWLGKQGQRLESLWTS